jgi:hypothetical protein
MHNHHTHHAVTLPGPDMTPLFGPRGQAAPHRTHYTAAMAFVQSHGHFAAITKDGLLCMSLEWADEMPITMTDATDYKVEVPMLFDVDADGFVVSREVRNWLGY